MTLVESLSIFYKKIAGSHESIELTRTDKKFRKMQKINIFSSILMTILLLLLNGCSNSKNENQVKKSVANLISAKKSDTVLIVSMNFNEKELLPIIGKKVSDFYHLPVKYQESILPKYAYYASRSRFSADSLNKYLTQINNGKYSFVAGLTSKDICYNYKNIPDYGIFGLASRDGSGCISSTFRLKKGVSIQKLTERLQKVVLHEIGHNHGLNHCTTPYPCFMKAANAKISVVDSEPMDICTVCRSKIKLSK